MKHATITFPMNLASCLDYCDSLDGTWEVGTHRKCQVMLVNVSTFVFVNYVLFYLTNDQYS